ncbi:hypothetical protein JRO89_XS01G0228000 [Xanthoceras sorbifolium]|uniref:TPX2 C-terminal domain-containing protein n=1 Tax=Xanthoceras sorbifolium TaxID=99658 RepID=A0ABQ8ILE7_9ROSI|nr:hypothetical protein JRO89_XS01G0228000 [Xanthoceras sorbifolium]
MGESACLMQPFSYASGISNEAKEGNPIHALGQSVSFGRFVSESLAWEKWSTFSHNKYVEEAEKYSRPGSVAQKKAFFEAHYKKIAAQKAAAALLEQASDAASSKTEPGESETEGEVNNVPTQDSKMMTLKSQVVKALDAHQTGFAVDANGCNNSNVAVDKSEGNKKVEAAAEVLKKQNILVEKNVNVESPNQLGPGNRKEDVKEMELKGTMEMETCVKVDSSGQPGMVDSDREFRELKLSEATQVEKPQLKSSMSKKKLELSNTKASSYGRASKQPSSPAKPIVSSQSKKETMATPMKKKSVVDLPDKRRSTPKSIHKSIYLTPAREINRLASSIIRKIDGSKVGSNSKPSKDCSTPLRTPTAASMSRAAKHPVTTPWSENKRTETTPLEPSTFGNKTVRAKWHFLPTEYEKLEEKFNASQAQKAQQQEATLKVVSHCQVKAETELRKLRQSLCFKARPLPDFYKERVTPKSQIKKVPLTQPQSPKLGRTPTLSAVLRKPSNPPQKFSTKYIGSNHALEKNMHNSTHSLTSRFTRITHENTSPNIQH